MNCTLTKKKKMQYFALHSCSFFQKDDSSIIIELTNSVYIHRLNNNKYTYTGIIRNNIYIFFLFFFSLFFSLFFSYMMIQC